MYYQSKSIWLRGSRAYGSLYLAGLDAHNNPPISLTPANTTTTWTVAKNASGSYCSMTSSATATTFTTTIKPDGSLSTVVGEGWVFGPYTGVFSKNTMSLQLNYIATTVNSQAGLVQYRLWKSKNINGTGASLITPTIQKTNSRTVVAGGSASFSSNFLMTSSLSMENEYIFIETAWGITTAGGANGCNVIFRAGSGSYLKTGPYEDNTIIILSDDNAPGYA